MTTQPANGLFGGFYSARALRRLRPNALNRWERLWPFAEQQPNEGWQRRWVADGP